METSMETLQALLWIFKLWAVFSHYTEARDRNPSELGIREWAQTAYGFYSQTKRAYMIFHTPSQVPQLVRQQLIPTIEGCGTNTKWLVQLRYKVNVQKTKRIFKYLLKTVIQDKPTGIHYQESRLGPQMSFLVCTYIIKSLERKFHMTITQCQDNLIKSPESLKTINNNRNWNTTLLSLYQNPNENYSTYHLGFEVFLFERRKRIAKF